MFIKSVVVDGFKSYAQRTEIHGFDKQFNAITGLNGSGKSNILDSICFVLGITNLSQVRAANLQDLVYKCGQAGINKATVSITFDNRDKKDSPLGYEQYDELTVTRQVVVGGRNKYLINGSNANNTRVHDLFLSVQLNVNNPHFLIMQGRITKVLNMKPPEILSMIEEAAGTRLYESKKAAAQKTIEKKDAKLREIETILKEEITPTLQKLREERTSYLEYQRVVRELEHLGRLHTAYQYTVALKTKEASLQELSAMEEAMESLRNRLKEIEQSVIDIDQEIAELESKRKEEQEAVTERLDKDLKEKGQAESMAIASLENKQTALKEEKKKLKGLRKSQAEDTSTMKERQKAHEALKVSLDAADVHHTECTDKLTAAQHHYEAVAAGLSSNKDGEDATLSEQLIAAKNEISQAGTDTKQAQGKIKHTQAELKKKKAELKSTDASYKKDQATLASCKQSVEKAEAELGKLHYEDGKEESLQSTRRSLSKAIDEAQEKLDMLEARYPSLRFEYRDPVPNFDRSSVYGLVPRLVQVKDVASATALEVAAGGKLFNVVVKDEKVAKDLIEKGQLKRSYTIIPLTKIAARSIRPDVVRKAQELVGVDKVSTALSLVGYDHEVEPAMKFVFGSSFVCKDMESANRVTFDKETRTRSVTLEGDSYDPSGTLTGGARRSTAPILSIMASIQELRQEVISKRKELSKVEGELAGIRGMAEKYRRFKSVVELKKREMEQLEGRIQLTTHHMQLEEIHAMEALIAEQEELIGSSAALKLKAQDKVKELENKLKNAASIREKELKEAEQKVAAAKATAEKTAKEMKTQKQKADGFHLEAEQLEQEIKGYEQQISQAEATILQLETDMETHKEAAQRATEEVNEVKAALKAHREMISAYNKDISKKHAKVKALKKEHSDAQNTLRETEHQKEKHKAEERQASKQLEHIMAKYDWVAEERQYFGQPNTAYDFATNDPKEAGRRITSLEETRSGLSKKVNMRAMNMLGKAEDQYNDLMKKRRIVLNDKAKIASVIEELDEKKNDALKKAYEQVNKDFGSIFSTLLPGTNAKLAPQEGASVLEGLEVKVAFGGVWKESLNELSGGQRSLVALSLILALLLFKPAPLYILDEVDAALDLSHTQNIGQMLKAHFQHSQFIVVSLKDGMFNNANVLFKTKFVDGVSTVTRYVQNQGKPPAATNKENQGPQSKKAQKHKRPRMEPNAAAVVE